MKFYNNRTITEQMNRLPLEFQSNYRRVQLDRIKIDDEEIQGYFEYSFLEEKSYVEQPTRAIDGSIGNINDIATILTPRVIIKYNMMNIDDYRRLMKKLKSKNSFNVTCYDVVEDKMVTHEMYVAPTQMPIIYQQYLMALGIQDFSIELIGTNNDDYSDVPPPEEQGYLITYDVNIPSTVENPYSQQDFLQYTDALGFFVVGAYDNENLIGSSDLISRDNKKGYRFDGWLNDTGTNIYQNGTTLTISNNTTLTAIWSEYSLATSIYTVIMHAGNIYTPIQNGHKMYYADTMQIFTTEIPQTITKTTENPQITLLYKLVDTLAPFGETDLLEEDSYSTAYRYIRWKFKGWSVDTNSSQAHLYSNLSALELNKPVTHVYMQWESEGVIDG